MSLCPLCKRFVCNHTPEERGQTLEEMLDPLSPEEEHKLMNNSSISGDMRFNTRSTPDSTESK